ncbi:hypothetical protein [Ectobacillus ponti]|uniref:Uncharacterized protein n=1 Tax=Ectobacillus ponti TaxID=2961894 RepID=A0AA42BSH8_9BACI|nr:hypothetical protein [Ectobacillus ponti]MCP8968458.1 hypothetical protein [Ectobacillus ponti]
MPLVSFGLMIAGALIAYIGYSVRRKGLTAFLAGNQDVFVPKNEKVLAGRIGLVIMLFGVETLLFPLAFQLIPGVSGTHFAVLAALHLLATFLCMLFDQVGV